jgi:ABC-type branched-chain amino acid transport systems, periplasmic component
MVKRTGKKYYLAALMLAVGLVVSGCGGDKKADSDTIKIGVNMEMTGNGASYGADGYDGVKLAVKEFNDKGGFEGKKIELVLADNKSESAESVLAAEKLMQSNVVAVIGPTTSSNAIAASQVYEANKVPGMGPTTTNPRVTVDDKGNVRQYTFRATFIDPFQGEVMAKFAIESMGVKTAAIYVDNSSDYSKGLAQFFEEAFTKAGGQVVIKEAYLQKDTDYKATLTKIKAANPDVIFIPGLYQEVGLIVKQARELDITVPLLGGDCWDSDKLVEIAGASNLNGTFFSTFYFAEDQDPKVVSFVEAYKKEYNRVPGAYAVLSYDGTNMVLEALQRAGSADPVKIQAELAKMVDFDGVSGKITINEKHDAVKGAVILGFQEGKQFFKEKINP